jgi:hypothetical protein
MTRPIKSSRISLRLSEREKLLVQMAAERAELSTAEFCRFALLNLLRQGNEPKSQSFGFGV